MSTITQFPSGNTQYRIEFDYLARTFVVVTLVNSSNPAMNRVLEVGRDYRFLNPTMIEMLIDQSGFDIVRIHRQTGTDLVVDFRNGSVLTASDLTNAELQAIHIAEEGRDQTVDLAKEYADAASSSAGSAKDSEDEARRIAENIKASGLIGHITRRSFEKGFNVTTWNEVLLWEEDGDYYRWDGTLPKNVPAGSTPETSGGIGLGAWVSVGDASLRSALKTNNGSNLVGTNNGLTVQQRLNLDRADISNYGYVYGSGADGKDAVLSAVSDHGYAHVTGATTLSSFDWPEGARLTGKATITYTRLPNVPCELDSEIPVDHSLMKAVYVHRVFDICDMLQLKTAGFNTLIHYGQAWTNGGNMEKACNAAEAVGLKLILGGPVYGQTNTPATDLDSRDCVIGYYLFDEPQNNSVSRAVQETRISAFKSFTEKSLCIAENGIFGFDSNTHPNGYGGTGYDIIFADAYYHDDWDDARNKRQAVIGWGELKYKCPTSRIVPCVGLFTTDANGGSDNFKNKAKQIAFAKKFFNMGDGEYAAFSWETQLIVNTHNTLTTDTDLYALGKELNSAPRQKPYDIDVYAFYPDRMGGAMQLYNDKYSSADVTPFQTINTGSVQGERNTTFKQGGIAARNTGGVFATRMKNHGYIAFELYYFNGADSANTSAAITTCTDDFYTNTEQLTFTYNNSNNAWIKSVETAPNLGVGIKLVPSASYNMRWKMVRGGIIDCSWRGEEI
ncbi:lyase [Escherichia phage PE3-1]|uniref:Lyase n=2 Tax=Kayfunavirus PE31 TaxID=2733642 RepID=A0A060DBA7_9CAUD|nr:tail protein [Escherichia phage PE3-1]AIB06996.1 lyase [Escherichia phage PE3-1]AOZ65186.1 hypothetical protein [Escherichia phage JSS1]